MNHTFVILAYNVSDDLEECIKSVINQSVKSNIVIATSTPNDYIIDLASEYSLGVMVNKAKSNKGRDYNFAIKSFDTELVTIAHQDDLYDRNYVKEIKKCYKKNKDATIIFTDNYEIHNDKKIKKSKKLFRIRYYLLPLKFRLFQNKKFFKLRSLRKDKFICTSSITFVKKNIDGDIFPTNLKYDNDWQGLIDLAKKDTRFVYLREKLVGYRVEEKEENKVKNKEDEKILKSLYPSWYYERVVKKRINKKIV
jgi:hypothetical protein